MIILPTFSIVFKEKIEKAVEILRKFDGDESVYEAFIEHRKSGANISKTALEIIRKMIKGEKVDQESSGISKREWDELMTMLG